MLLFQWCAGTLSYVSFAYARPDELPDPSFSVPRAAPVHSITVYITVAKCDMTIGQLLCTPSRFRHEQICCGTTRRSRIEPQVVVVQSPVAIGKTNSPFPLLECTPHLADLGTPNNSHHLRSQAVQQFGRLMEVLSMGVRWDGDAFAPFCPFCTFLISGQCGFEA